MKLSGKLQCPLTNVTFVFCATQEELIKQADKIVPNYFTVEDNVDGTTLRMSKDDFCYVLIWATRGSTLAHECVHACDYAFEHIGQPPLGEGNELHAYYVGMLFSNYCTVLNKGWNDA